MNTKSFKAYSLMNVLWIIMTIQGCTDSKTLIYELEVTAKGQKHQHIAKQHANGTKSETLIKNGTSPQWIPGEKTHFAYIERKTGEPDQKLWVAKEDGKDAVALTDFEIHFDYSWSPDGEWILVSSTKDGNHEIYKIKKDGSKSVRLTNNNYTDQFPRWRPKGNKIVYVSPKMTMQNKLFLIDSNGQGAPKQITPNNLNVYADYYSRPCWSPDGKRVAFIAHSGTSYDIFTVNIATENIVNITNKKRVYEHVCWYDIYILYFDYNDLIRYNTKTKQIDPPHGLGRFVGQTPHSPISVNASHAYFSYAKDSAKPTHIYTVQHYTGDITVLGRGKNPDVW